MGIFAISFRVRQMRDYIKRHLSLTQAIEREAIGTIWADTEAFYIIRSDKSAAELAKSLVSGSLFAEDDKLLVVNLSEKAVATAGDISHSDELDKLMGER